MPIALQCAALTFKFRIFQRTRTYPARNSSSLGRVQALSLRLGCHPSHHAVQHRRILRAAAGWRAGITPDLAANRCLGPPPAISLAPFAAAACSALWPLRCDSHRRAGACAPSNRAQDRRGPLCPVVWPGGGGGRASQPHARPAEAVTRQVQSVGRRLQRSPARLSQGGAPVEGAW